LLTLALVISCGRDGTAERNKRFFYSSYSLKISAVNATPTLYADGSLHANLTTPVIDGTEKETEKRTVYNHGGLYWSSLEVSGRHCHAEEIESVNDSDFLLIHSHSGYIPRKKLYGLIGPSGAGKSTLLAALGQFENRQPKRTRQIFLVDSDRNRWESFTAANVAWLPQHASFFELLTVRETLTLAAFFEEPSLSPEKRDEMVQRTLRRLGLSHASDRFVGSELDGATNTAVDGSPCRTGKRSSRASRFFSFGNVSLWFWRRGRGGRLSGGERRRLAVARELLTDAKSVFLGDEVTSGLDSTQSVQILSLVRQLIRDQDVPALVSLHQPRSILWNHLLDGIVLIAPGGHVCFVGPIHEVLPYFQRLGFSCPPATNPAEFLLDLVSIHDRDSDESNAWAIPLAGERKSQHYKDDLSRIAYLSEEFRNHQRREHKKLFPFSQVPIRDRQQSVLLVRNARGWKVSVRRFGSLLKRSWLQNIRNHSTNIFRLGAGVVNALLLTAIFPSVREATPTAKSLADRVALLSFGAINLCMMAYMKAVDLFGKELPVVRREQQRRQYASLEYLLAKVLAEIPLDATFAAVFTTVLKLCTGLRIRWGLLTSTFALLTASGAALGFAVGSATPNPQLATVAGKCGQSFNLILILCLPKCSSNNGLFHFQEYQFL
jgi:ABC-type multidrug transport system ATPase subunit